jgi:hemolysin activation/secretion protein
MSSRVWIVLCGCTVLAGIGGPAQGQQSQGQQSQGQPSTPRKEPTFDIREIRVNGNSVLSTREIERVITPFLGEKRHFSDVEGARKALEDAYEKAGYQTVFVDIPEQRVNAGVVYLHVLEGKVGQVHVTGSRYFDEDQIRATVPQLSSGNVPDFTRMQQEMAELNKSSDRQVAPVLTPGRTPGTVDVNLSVKDALPLHGDIEDDNHASPFTKPDRLNASLHYDNLWQQQHSLAVNYQLAPQKPSETNVLYATYLWRFAQSDDVLSIYGIRSNSNIAVVGSSTILGNSKILGARYIVPIGSGETDDARYFHSFTFGIDRKDFAQTNISAQFSDITVLPQIDYVPLSLTYSSVLVRNSRTEQFSLGVVTAPRSLFGNTDAKFESRRVFGTASYYVWKWDASLEQTISRRWTFYTRFTGQWTFDPLIPNEQFVTGGADSVRGYRESEISGDRGANGTLEARWYPRGHSVDPTAASLYLCAFTDGAQVRLVHPSGPQISLISIASTGVGVHAQGWHGVHLALDVAKDLRDGGRGVTGPITPEGSVRVEASLGYTF